MKRPDAQPLVAAFPMPDTELALKAYWNLRLAEEGTEEEKEDIGDASRLPRPWDLGACLNPELRAEIWDWLEAFVTWFNHEYVWDPAAGMIPPCWPQHPHLVHDINVLADQRRRAALALTSNPLEEWQRYAVPQFLERTRNRIKQHCDHHHQPSPARTRNADHNSADSSRARGEAYESDVDACTLDAQDCQLQLVDEESGRPINPVTGQVLDSSGN